ncbi:MAG: hypothetical protein HY335_06270, partial [Deinococcus sp.]|nr:hypothetical protein [Deinococcus sp.]
GEDGFEIFVPWEGAPETWRAMVALGAKPCGLGARDTLRLEMGYALYGHELTMDTTPYQAGLGWVVKPEKGDFIGKAAMLQRQAAGTDPVLIGLQLTSRGAPPRQSYPVHSQGRAVGEVTSGTLSPTLEVGIALAYVKPACAQVGTSLDILARGRPTPAQVVGPPFVKKGA